MKEDDKKEKKSKLKEMWRAYRLAFDPGYPLIDEFLPEVWGMSVREKVTNL